MRLYRHPDEFRRSGDDRPLWVTLGTFDGLHIGHRYLIDRLQEEARQAGGDAATMVITFELHPQVVLAHRPPRPLLSLDHKLRLLEASGVDSTLLLRFDEQLARVEATDFVRDWLVERLRVSGVVLGYDARFGHHAHGDFDLLAGLADELGFIARQGEPVRLADGETVSSTAIREALARADLDRAKAMLGRAFSLVGRVTEGAKLGRELGFPTANIRLDHETLLPFGVYGVRVRDVPRTAPADDSADADSTVDLPTEGVLGAANVGVRPTVDNQPGQVLLEVHLLDWSGDLYGRELEVEFHQWVRPEWKFDGLDALKQEIARDCERVREWDATHREPE